MLIVLGGPTASGKSALALALAEKLTRRGRPAEILCADSITIYRGFDVGAAKPNAEDRARVPHHLLDLADSHENFTTGDFVKHGEPLLHGMLAKKITPILVGGTGFYLRALLRGMAGTEEDPIRSAQVKTKLEARGKTEGWETLHRELLARDPASAATVHLHDHYRIVRALQAMEMQGQPWSELNRLARATPPRFPNRFFKLQTEKEELKTRIETRTQTMLAHGLIEEVQSLLARGVSPDSKPMQSVGYKETAAFLRGDLTRAELAPAISLATLKLAKQQTTWFRGEELGEWLAEPYLPSLLSALDFND